MNKKPAHNFHIPVMGLAYTIDSPIRVAQFGISWIKNKSWGLRKKFGYSE